MLPDARRVVCYLVYLITRLSQSQAYPDPEYKLNKSAVSELVLRGRGGRAARGAELTYSALAPAVPVVVHWRALHTQLDHIR